MKKFYVLGFLFSPDLKYVALIRKVRPEWQSGCLNGIGGKIELYDDLPMAAMIREFEEETGLKFTAWNEFSIMKGTGWEVYCYRGVYDDLAELRTVTDEEVEIIEVAKLSENKVLSNLHWLIPMATDVDKVRAEIFYV